ncbi:MAG: hypothetical protein JWM02_2338 [Frankiales bacterium]|nr:hypothetical protein [Frankiales bacterium]
MELPPPTTSPILDEATKRSGVVWVALEDHRPRLVWHLWHDEGLWLVCGGLEQELPGAGTATRAVVTVRSKATQNDRLVSWQATVSRIAPDSAEWEAVVPLLHAQRLNAPDGEDQPARWARESTVLKLFPTGELVQSGHDPELTEPR